MSAPVYVFSAGLWRLRREVQMMSDLQPRRTLWFAGHHGAIAGWGHKPTAQRARREAVRTGLPYLAFEDGFLRSVKPGSSQAPVSMVMDRTGIYYDARLPSDLETLLQDGEFDQRDTDEALALVTEIARRRLSKYNHAPDRIEGVGTSDGKLVVVLDQTFEDASVAGGLADANSFTRMLAAAQSENPGGVIAVKLHPEVIAGTKPSYLRDAARNAGLMVLAEDVSPWALLELKPHIYTVSSQLGFEALLAGCRVTCFGVPFYAGWGLTDDRMSVARRTRRRGLGDIAAAVYLRYCHYFDAWRRTPVTAFEAVEQLDFLRRHYHGNSRKVFVAGVARWKRPAVRAMLDGPCGPPHFVSSIAAAAAAARDAGGIAAAWGLSAQAVRETGAECLAIEDGFVRSAGLGAALVQPMSLVFDRRGIYYDPRQPSDIEHALQHDDIPAEDAARARRLAARITAERVTKYNLPDCHRTISIPDGKEAILVPGQVADDAAVMVGEAAGAPAGSNVNSMLLAAARYRNPQAFVIFKPHPDVEQLGRRGALTVSEERSGSDYVARHDPIDALLPLVQTVETYSSLAGFEALLRGIAVTAHGLPFYAGWGLTTDMVRIGRRSRTRSLDELVFAALIGYPRYWDPVSRLACPPEVVLDRLAEQRGKRPGVVAKAMAVAGRAIIVWRRMRPRG